jgi:hypothetical protein
MGLEKQIFIKLDENKRLLGSSHKNSSYMKVISLVKHFKTIIEKLRTF